MKKEEKKLNKIIFFRFAFIGAALLMVAAFWYVLNWETRPIFIQKEMAVFKENYDGTGLGFTFGQGSVKGRGYARILGWGYGWRLKLDKGQEKQFLWFSWTTQSGRVYFDFSSNMSLTEQDILTLMTGETGERENLVMQGYAPFHGTRIQTPDNWLNYCGKETESVGLVGVTERLVCVRKEKILEDPLYRLKRQIPSISSMKVEEYLFSR